MNCKNCNLPLRTDYSFCSNCGAKIIRNRLTLKNLWYDLTERYFNVDNTFLKTLRHLFSKPEVVIGGYVDGIRKKYLNPISYYAIAITLSGLLFFLLKEFFSDQMNMDWMMPEAAENPNEEIFDNTAKFQTVISLASIPVYALFSKLMFLKNKSYNYTEHIIINIYLFAQFTIATFPVILIALVFGANYLVLTYSALLFQVFYVAYVLKRIFKLTWKKTIWKTIVFLALLFFLFIVLIIISIIVMIIFGGGIEGLKK